MKKFAIAITLSSIFAMHGMNEQQRPTINAIIRFEDNKKTVSYLTEQNLKYLKDKGIAQPVLPIKKAIKEVEVIENNKKINWLEKVPTQIINFENAQIRSQNLTFDKALPAHLAIKNTTFPKYLPVELINNCHNGSVITFQLGNYTVQATVQGQNDLYGEHAQSMEMFFAHPTIGLSLDERESLVTSQHLNKRKLDLTLANLPIASFTCYTHGDNGYDSNKKITHKLCEKTIAPHGNMRNYLKNREIGRRAQPTFKNDNAYLEKVLSDIAEETLMEIENTF